MGQNDMFEGAADAPTIMLPQLNRRRVPKPEQGAAPYCNPTLFLLNAVLKVDWGGVRNVLAWGGVGGRDRLAGGLCEPENRFRLCRDCAKGRSAETGRLKPGTYVYSDRPAGRHELIAGETLFPGETKRDITTESGRTYFFLTKTSDRHNSVTGMTLFGGLTGAVVASVVTSGSNNPGPADFFLLNEASARTTIAELQLAE